MPVIIFSIAIALQYDGAQRAAGRVDAQETASSLSALVDREIVGLMSAMQALATSPSLAEGGSLPAFEQQARDVLRQRGLSIEVSDRSGKQLVNTEMQGVALPISTDPTILSTNERVFQTGMTQVSDLFKTAGGQPVVIVSAPVFRHGVVALTLSIAVDSTQLSALLAQALLAQHLLAQTGSPGWTASIIDRNDVIIARSRRLEVYVGQVASLQLRQHTTGDLGTWAGHTREGRDVLSAFVRSPVSNWRVSVNVPLTTIEAPAQRLTVIIVLSGICAALIALVCALWFASKITVPMARLAEAAAHLGRGNAVPHITTGLAEVDAVGAALVRANAERIGRQSALQASEERFRAAVRAVEGILWTNDPSGRMSGEQPGWSMLTGQTREEYEGFGWSTAVHPEDAAPTVQAWTEAVLEHKTFIFEHRVRRHDGVYRRYYVRAVPTEDSEARITGWVGVHTDVTEEYEDKARLTAQDRELRDLNAQLGQRVAETSAERDRIWRISSELMIVLTVDGVILATNPAWERTLEWTEAELLGRSILDLQHPDDRPQAVEKLALLAAGAGPLSFENRYPHKRGGHHWLAWTAVAESGKLYAIGRDITAEKAAAEALQRTEEQLRQSQKMEVVGQLTGGIAHDFNNLLTVVTGHLDMAKRRLETDKGVDRLLRNIASAQEGARRAAVLTQRLLAFSRQSALQPEMIDLNTLIEGMTDLIQRTLGERIEVCMEPGAGIARVSADLNQLENAILNLCVNARDAMSPGGLLRLVTSNLVLDPTSALVETNSLPAGRYAVVAVIDDGAGIPAAIRDRIFEPFFTTKPIGQGTGLGLSQVGGFMRQSGGLADVASVEGEGTTVRLILPQAPISSSPPPSGESSNCSAVIKAKTASLPSHVRQTGD